MVSAGESFMRTKKMRIIMLEHEVANDIASVLNWAINRSDDDGETLQADRFRILKKYLSSASSSATEMFTPSDLARRGGLSKSDLKSATARQNGKSGGFPGNYYASARVVDVDEASARTGRKYLFFTSKDKRDQWVQAGPPGQREALPATDTGLRWTQRNHLEWLLNGDEIFDSLADREELYDQFEKYHELD